MSYLFQNDMKTQIQIGNLNQVINNDETILSSAMLDAENLATQYLSSKYQIDLELTDTDAYDNKKTYQANQRIYLDGTLYNASSSYNIGDIALFNGNVYVCIATIVAENFNPAHWAKLGAQYSMYYVPQPYAMFNVNQPYKVGTIVFWKGKTYTCQIASLSIDHTIALQLDYYSNIPLTNVFPDDPDVGLKYWGVGTTYTVTAGTLPSAPWVAGDNRQRMLVRHMIAIVLYNIHKRISPMNIPVHINRNYMGDPEHGVATRDGYIYPDYSALGWLQSLDRGGMPGVGLIPIQPRAGGRIRWGSKIRNQNGF